ncbi:MAG: hypothetical protein R3C68_13220 [Myxococcota bacterium]
MQSELLEFKVPYRRIYYAMERAIMGYQSRHTIGIEAVTGVPRRRLRRRQPHAVQVGNS